MVIPCYNHEQFVQDSIQSVIDQTYQNIELIIIDDGSKDSSVEKIQQMIPVCEHRFTRFEFRSRPNKGLSATLNEALTWCEGEYYSAIASDDQILKDKISNQVEYIAKNKNCIALFGGYILIDEKGQFISNNKKEARVYTFEEIFVHRYELPAPTQFICLETLKRVGGYQQDVIIEDWYMWLKLAKIGEIHYISEYLSKYRNHLDNTSKKVEVMNRGRIQILNFYIDEPLYKKAKQEIDWIYLRELKGQFFKKFIKEFIRFSIFNPLFTIYNIFIFLFKKDI